MQPDLNVYIQLCSLCHTLIKIRLQSNLDMVTHKRVHTWLESLANAAKESCMENMATEMWGTNFEEVKIGQLSIAVIALDFCTLFSIICPSLISSIQFLCHGSVCWSIKVFLMCNTSMCLMQHALVIMHAPLTIIKSCLEIVRSVTHTQLLLVDYLQAFAVNC